ncbi:G-protein alpha subunit-domain-containing protein, partial [Mycena capillaripes]
MPPLSRQDTRQSILSWWSDSNPGLHGATINLHAVTKPLLKAMYHRQALSFIKQSRGVPLSSEVLSTFSSYLPLNYVSSSTKVAILAELLNRAEVEDDDTRRAIFGSPVWAQVPHLLASPDTDVLDLASRLLYLWDFGMNNGSMEQVLIFHAVRRTDVSNAIDAALTLELKHRRKGSFTILLLGQEQSGKSTFLKSLQLLLAPQAFQAQAEAWRPIIHLNLVRSVNFVLSLLDDDAQSLVSDGRALSDHLRRLSTGLGPLQQVEEMLSNRIAGFRRPSERSQAGPYHPAKVFEISVPSGSGLSAFLRFHRGSTKVEELQTGRILSACAGDIMTLWDEPEVQQRLQDRKITLQDQSGFFLDEVQRICQEDYIPTLDDILRARVHDVGVTEHFIEMEDADNKYPKIWTVYEMDGSIGQRATWAQFFDNVHAMIFLAPVSAFDETLAEDHTVNRLADSFKLWKTICNNQLLKSVAFILILNKVDILTRKIQSGVQFAQYVTSYGNKPNELREIVRYVSNKFAKINTRSARQGGLYCHATSAL